MLSKPCTFEGCTRPALAKGLCSPHYQQVRKGKPLAPVSEKPRNRAQGDAEERFWAKVEKTETCWLWTGSADEDGYGYHTDDGKTIKAHRFSYLLNVGAITEALCVCHTCDNPSCVRPSHLWLGTNPQNTQDKIAKGRARYLRGEAVPTSIVTEHDVIDIRTLHGFGATVKDLAGAFGLSYGGTLDIVRYHNWKHVP